VTAPLRQATALTAALALAACGEDKEGSVKIEDSATGTSTSATAPTATTEVPPVGAPVAEIKLTESDFKLAPANPSVPKAGIVLITAKNDGPSEHAIEVEGPDGESETKPIEPGKTATLKVNLDKDGTYEWYCPIDDHKDKGMKTITVGKGGTVTSGDDSGKSETEDESGDDSPKSGY